MPHLFWLMDKAGKRIPALALLPQHVRGFILTPDRELPVKVRGEREDLNQPCIMQSQVQGREAWVLLVPRDSTVRVNGNRLPAGIRVLRDRDEILFEGVGRLYFGTEKLAKVEPFRGGAESVLCPRCKQAIPDGTPAVRCPACERWHHQSEHLPCWDYSDQCTVCPQSSDLEGSYRWTPASL